MKTEPSNISWMFLKLRTNKFPFIITVEKFSKLIKRKQYWRNALWNVPVLLLIWWLSVFPPWFNTNQQMLVIVGHTLEKGWSEPLKYWEMALTAHKVLHKAKGDTKLHVISFIFFFTTNFRHNYKHWFWQLGCPHQY